jgi:hypothetical protein
MADHHEREASLSALAVALVAAGATAAIAASSRQFETEVEVLVTRDGAGYKFDHFGDHVERNGDIDLSVDGPQGRPVRLEFTIADGSAPGIKFKPTGKEAFWIVEKAKAGVNGEPTKFEGGDQFTHAATLDGGQRLQVINVNSDGKRFRYSLVFDLNGETVVDDPDMGNGGHGGD